MTITLVNELGERLRSARDAIGLTQQQLATRAGVSQGTIGNFEAGRGRVPRKIIEICAALNVRPEWLLYGRQPMTPISPGGLVAHPVSPESVTIPLQDKTVEVNWGETVIDDLPQEFVVSAPDDAMADRVAKGDRLKFDRRIAPKAGDGVLVVDAAGSWFFRIYSPGSQGRFAAVAKNPAFQPLDSERDGLTVVAVLVGIPSVRWG